jgi:hypothetical protein
MFSARQRRSAMPMAGIDLFEPGAPNPPYGTAA